MPSKFSIGGAVVILILIWVIPFIVMKFFYNIANLFFAHRSESNAGPKSYRKVENNFNRYSMLPDVCKDSSMVNGISDDSLEPNDFIRSTDYSESSEYDSSSFDDPFEDRKEQCQITVEVDVHVDAEVTEDHFYKA